MSATPTPAYTVGARSTAGTAQNPAAQGAQTSPNAGGSGTDSATAGSELTATLEALRKQADGQSAVINRLTRELKELRSRVEPTPQEPAEEREPAAGEGEGDGKKAYKSPYMRQLQELKEFKSQVESERAALMRDSVAQNILFSLTLKGIDGRLSGIVAESLLGRLGNRVASAKDSLGRTTLEVKGESDGEEAVSLEKWLDAFMSSDEGKALLPAVPNPSLKGVPIRRGGATEGKIRISKDDMRAGRFDHEAMAAGKVVVVE